MGNNHSNISPTTWSLVINNVSEQIKTNKNKEKRYIYQFITEYFSKNLDDVNPVLIGKCTMCSIDDSTHQCVICKDGFCTKCKEKMPIDHTSKKMCSFCNLLYSIKETHCIKTNILSKNLL